MRTRCSLWVLFSMIRKNLRRPKALSARGLDLDPDSWTGHYYLGLALTGLNRFEEAEKSAREALRQKTDFAEAHLLLADIHGREKNFPALVNDLDEYLRLDPDSPTGVGVRALRESARRILFETQSATVLAEPQS